MNRILPALASAVPAVLWVVLAWRSPTSTHHFAPFVVAAVWGFLADPVDRTATIRAALGGIGVALVALVVLLAADRLQGPTLWGARPSYPELVGFAVLGGGVTVLRARRRATPAGTR